MLTQKDQVLSFLSAGFTITPMEALERYNCFRLSSIIFDLRREGYRIKTIPTTKGKKVFATYKLLKDGELF